MIVRVGSVVERERPRSGIVWQVPTDKARAFAFDIDWDAVHASWQASLGCCEGIEFKLRLYMNIQ